MPSSRRCAYLACAAMLALASGCCDNNVTVNIPSPVPDLEILEPTAATVWLPGQADVVISWSGGDEAKDVDLYLYDGNDPVAVIASAIPNEGGFDGWAVPADLAPDTDYRVRIEQDDDHAFSELFEVGQVAPAAFFSDDFSAGLDAWTNESSGPGLGGGVVEIVAERLHLDSRASSNYYLDYSHTIDLEGDISGATISWYWALDAIERSYGLAEFVVTYYDASAVRLGDFRVRRHTGDFWQYPAESLISRWADEQPGVALKVDDATGTVITGATYSFVMDQAFWDSFDVLTVDPAQVASVKILLRSYNNAGAGVDMWVDDVALTP